ncbi:MAG: alkaline phosphatase family protein [Candidatus Gottesmanbacteria bacterium]
MKKILVLGIDGATWKLLDPWIKEGCLPNFAKITDNGYTCTLLSTIPPMTPPAWISFSTGKNPGKHGIFDFFDIVNGQKHVINSTYIKSKQIWDLLSEQEKKVIVINPIISYPVSEVNGYLIAGMLTPSYEVAYTYPPRLKQQLKKWGYKIGVELDPGMRSNWARSFVFNQDRKKRQVLIDFFNQISINRWQIFKRLSQKLTADFSYILFEGADRLQHYYWKNKDLYVIREYYQCLDKILGEAITMYKNDLIMVVSDHGCGEIRKKFYINNLLMDLGLLKTTNKNGVIQFVLKKAKQTVLKLTDLGLSQESLLTNKKIFQIYQKLYQPAFNLNTSQAYMINETSRGIWINCQDNSQNYKIRKMIISKLNSLRDPITKKPIAKAFGREEIYQGLHTEEAPDILVVTYPGYSLEVIIDPGLSLKRAYLKPTSRGERNGDHEMEGILMVYGQGIKKLKTRLINNCPKIIDIAPTIYKMLNVPIPIDTDGQTLAVFNGD